MSERRYTEKIGSSLLNKVRGAMHEARPERSPEIDGPSSNGNGHSLDTGRVLVELARIQPFEGPRENPGITVKLRTGGIEDSVTGSTEPISHKT